MGWGPHRVIITMSLMNMYVAVRSASLIVETLAKNSFLGPKQLDRVGGGYSVRRSFRTVDIASSTERSGIKVGGGGGAISLRGRAMGLLVCSIIK